MRLRFDDSTFDYQTLRAAAYDAYGGAAVAGEATVRVCTEQEGAADHCQLGNLALAHGVVYDWLDDAFGTAER